MGVWEEGKAGPRHINSVDRSSDRGHVVAGDDAGIVRLLHYPCVARGAGSARFIEATAATSARSGSRRTTRGWRRRGAWITRCWCGA